MGILDKIKKTDKESKSVSADKDVTSAKAASKKAAPKKAVKKTAPKADTASSSAKKTGSAYRVLLHPHVSEKASDAASLGKYTFVVALTADKTAIKNAVEHVYGVRPVSVTTANIGGKKTRFGLTQGRRSDWKKAVVTLPKGKTITIHEGV